MAMTLRPSLTSRCDRAATTTIPTARTARTVRTVRTGMTEFTFATCAVGVEPALKREVARTRPELRFAYSRPGLVTFRSPRPIEPDDEPGSVFARVWGASLGPATTPAEAAARLAEANVDRVHAWRRDLDTLVEPRHGHAPAAVA